MMDQLKELLDDHQLYHSGFQMDFWITTQNGSGTHYGMYRQALRELYKRARGLKGLYTEEALLLIDIEEMQSKQSFGSDYDAKRSKVRLRKAEGDLGELRRNIADTEREFNHFFAQCAALKKTVGELTPERREKLEAEMWRSKMEYMIASDRLIHGVVLRPTIDMIASAPTAMREELVGLAKQISRPKAESIVFQSGTILPNVQDVKKLDLRKLLDG